MKKITGLRCVSCGKLYGPKELDYTCPDCGTRKGTLEVVYDYEAAGKRFREKINQTGFSDIKRYSPLLPVEDLDHLPPLKVGGTPLYSYHNLTDKVNKIWIKDDSGNPTASYKDRATVFAIAAAKQRGIDTMTCASTGNAASSLAGLAAASGMKTVIFVPGSAPEAKIAQLLVYGANVFAVDGSYDEAYDLCLEAADKYGWYNRSAAIHPYLVEGKKTGALEMADQLNWNPPNKIFVSVGDESIISGLCKGFTELAKLDLSDNAEALASLEQVMTAGLRARDLVQHILTFSRKADVQHQVIKIVPLVKECLKFIKASAPPDIAIRKKMMEKEVAVLADPSQIHQMIMNLLTNAVHAMKEGGGTLDVTIKSIIIHTDEILQTRDISAGRYVQILISDTGCGIPGPLKEKIFEPFFTTKRRGEGTGMGLSTVYGIVKDLKGDISVYSEPGTGTTFQVLIPEKKTGADQEIFLTRAALVTGKGSILVVDDEPSIVAWTSKVLAKIGYAVAVASGGQKALDMLANDPDGFDLVLTDLAMPKMDGLALSQQINRICPDIPIILCTGFSEGLKNDLVKNYSITAMIMKPMIASELSAIVNKVLKMGRQKEPIQ
mgnify:CR=1 FL=1